MHGGKFMQKLVFKIQVTRAILAFLIKHHLFLHQNKLLWFYKLSCRSKDEWDTAIRFPCHGFGILDTVQYSPCECVAWTHIIIVNDSNPNMEISCPLLLRCIAWLVLNNKPWGYQMPVKTRQPLLGHTKDLWSEWCKPGVSIWQLSFFYDGHISLQWLINSLINRGPPFIKWQAIIRTICWDASAENQSQKNLFSALKNNQAGIWDRTIDSL